MTDWRRAYVDGLRRRLHDLDREREALREEISSRGPFLAGALTVVSIAVAALGVSVTAPVVSLLGLAAAFGTAPLSVKALVDRTEKVERLQALQGKYKELEHEIDRLDQLDGES